MRVAVVTPLWPNRIEPHAAAFNRQQIKALSRRCDVEVVNAVPFVPLASRIGKPERPARLATLPPRDVVDGIPTTHLRQLYVPKVGVPVAVPLYLASLTPHWSVLRRADVVLATWLYPDGVATILAARALGKPVFVKVHGTDVNYVATLRTPRLALRRVLPLADGCFAVSRALGAELVRLGAPPERVHLVPNGVDGTVFHPRSREDARRELGLAPSTKLVVFVGRLEREKGVFELLDALAALRAERPDVELALVGHGSARAEVEGRARNVGPAVRLVGNAPLPTVATWLAAADVFTLPSWREGTPNVVLEALACARPVVATKVGGIPDVLPPTAGILVPPRDVAALTRGLDEALARPWDEGRILAAAPPSWDASADALYTLLTRSSSASAARNAAMMGSGKSP